MPLDQLIERLLLYLALAEQTVIPYQKKAFAELLIELIESLARRRPYLKVRIAEQKRVALNQVHQAVLEVVKRRLVSVALDDQRNPCLKYQQYSPAAEALALADDGGSPQFQWLTEEFIARYPPLNPADQT